MNAFATFAAALKSELSAPSFLSYATWTVPAILVTGMISGRLAGSGRNNAWFKTIVKPSIFPPGIVFPIAWTAIYIGMGSALALVLAEPPSSAPHRSLSLGLFGAQLVLNYSWSPIFFKMHRMKLALAATGGMIVTTVPAAVLFWNIKPTAGLLLAPYLAWLAFAFMLNYRFIQCNPQSNGNGSSKKLKGRTQE